MAIPERERVANLLEEKLRLCLDGLAPEVVEAHVHELSRRLLVRIESGSPEVTVSRVDGEGEQSLPVQSAVQAGWVSREADLDGRGLAYFEARSVPGVCFVLDGPLLDLQAVLATAPPEARSRLDAMLRPPDPASLPPRLARLCRQVQELQDG